MSETNLTTLFPFATFRTHQEEIIKKCINEFEKGTEVVIIDGPTGFGKSPVNIAIGRYFNPSFYTTPQSKLVKQLAVDFGPDKLIIDGGKGFAIPLLARKQYTCKASNKNSDECPFRNHIGRSKCMRNKNCTYWKQKEGVFNADIGILTFSNLIVNSYLPTYLNDGMQISFDERELLIVDECHSLESQVASLHAGFRISPYVFPKVDTEKTLQMELWKKCKDTIPIMFNDSVDEWIPFLKCVQKELKDLGNLFEHNEKEQQKVNNLLHKIKYLFDEINIKREWVVNLEKKQEVKEEIPYFKPTRVDRFLQKHIWCYASKYLLTSATIPYRNNIGAWLNRIGLGGKEFTFLQVPMGFPRENRPIHLHYGGELNYRNKQENWGNCIRNVKEILLQHKNQKGVIHCSSFYMCNEIYKSLYLFQDDLFVHTSDLKSHEVIQKWIESEKDIIISPSIYEGVDLKDDLCRFQILFKVPYLNIKDNRTKYFLNVQKDWEWYNNETAMKIIQAYGRAVRHKKDHAEFYIIDSDFKKLFLKVEFPKYFRDAIIEKEG